MNCVIESAKRDEHAQIIAKFQVEMAKETENMDSTPTSQIMFVLR